MVRYAKAHSCVGKWLTVAVAGLAAAGMMVGTAGAASAEEAGSGYEPTNASTAGGSAISTKGSPVCMAGNLAKVVSNVQVSDVGAHTANVSFDYNIPEEDLCWDQAGPVDLQKVQIRPYVSVVHITSMTSHSDAKKPVTIEPTNNNLENANPDLGGFVPDATLNAAQYKSSYGEQHKKFMTEEPVDFGDNWQPVPGTGPKAVDVTGQFFNRTNTEGTHDLSGHLTMPVIGLEASTDYSPQGLVINGFDYGKYEGSSTTLDYLVTAKATELSSQGKKDVPTPVNITRIAAGVNISFGHVGWSDYQDGSVALKTKAEPTAAGSADQLPADGENGIVVGDGENAGQVKPGSDARLYIQNLKDSCKTKVDANEDCFWYSYIYSAPQQLTTDTGQPYMPVEKDDQGRYYVDVLVPAGLTGQHTLSLIDDNGDVQGWTKVRMAGTAAANKTKLQAAVDAAAKLKSDGYTADSWKAFDAALASARRVLGDAGAVQADADNALRALTEAKGNLAKPVVPAVHKEQPKDEKQPTGEQHQQKSESAPKSDPAKQKAPVASSLVAASASLGKTGSAIAVVATIAAALAIAGAGVLVIRHVHA